MAVAFSWSRQDQGGLVTFAQPDGLSSWSPCGVMPTWNGTVAQNWFAGLQLIGGPNRPCSETMTNDIDSESTGGGCFTSSGSGGWARTLDLPGPPVENQGVPSACARPSDSVLGRERWMCWWSESPWLLSIPYGAFTFLTLIVHVEARNQTDGETWSVRR